MTLTLTVPQWFVFLVLCLVSYGLLRLLAKLVLNLLLSTRYKLMKPYFYMAGKVEPGYITTPYTRFGRYWWFWLPRSCPNDGSFKRGSKWVTIGVQWLCFGFSADWVRK